MLATWKASAGFVRIRICFHLISALPPKLQTTRLTSGPKAIRCGRVLSNEIKLDHGFHLRNLDGISPTSADGLCGGGSTNPVLINTGLQAGVHPALISIKPFQRLYSMSHGAPPDRRAMLIGAQLTGSVEGRDNGVRDFPLKPGLIFHRA